ncbi:hypothetical protein PLESTF_001077300 [Pleodorina starrii]|nr:hypothetical protein PLESTF_001077300 [Pleodorina starrii]
MGQLAIDGIIPADGSSESTFMTAANNTVRWFSIDFGELVTINRIVYYNRRDCCGENVVGINVRFGGARSTTADADVVTQNPVVIFTGLNTRSSTGAVLTVDLVPLPTGRFLSFHTVFASAIYVAELEAYGTPAGAQRRDMHVRQLPI